MAKIANPDRTAMNRLYAKEMARGGVKFAAVLTKGENGSVTPDGAFKDHEEYLSTLEQVMKEDKKVAFDPNDPIMD
jgi:hypothetical protein